jgi:hypothetical protein
VNKQHINKRNIQSKINRQFNTFLPRPKNNAKGVGLKLFLEIKE